MNFKLQTLIFVFSVGFMFSCNTEDSQQENVEEAEAIAALGTHTDETATVSSPLNDDKAEVIYDPAVEYPEDIQEVIDIMIFKGRAISIDDLEDEEGIIGGDDNDGDVENRDWCSTQAANAVGNGYVIPRHNGFAKFIQINWIVFALPGNNFTRSYWTGTYSQRENRYIHSHQQTTNINFQGSANKSIPGGSGNGWYHVSTSMYCNGWRTVTRRWMYL